jgi:hypothetical protein
VVRVSAHTAVPPLTNATIARTHTTRWEREARTEAGTFSTLALARGT